MIEERDLPHGQQQVLAEGAEVAARGDAGTRGTIAASNGKQDGKAMVDEDEAGPEQGRVQRQRPAGRQRQEPAGADSVRRRLSSIFHAPISGSAGAVDHRAMHRAGRASMAATASRRAPSDAARGSHVVARRKFLDDLDIGDETGAREDSLEQVVAEQRALGTRDRRAPLRTRRRRRCPCRHRSLRRTDPGTRRRRRRHTDRARACSRRCVERAIPRAHRQRRRDSRLQYGIALDDASASRRRIADD